MLYLLNRGIVTKKVKAVIFDKQILAKNAI